MTASSPRLGAVPIAIIAPMYERVFNDAFNHDRLAEKALKGEIEPLALFCGKEPVGFALCQRREKSYHLWIAGLLPRWQGKGLGHEMLRLFEARAKEAGFSRVTLTTNNQRRKLLALAIRDGYQIVGTEPVNPYGQGVKIRLAKELVPKPEVRFMLTDRCNLDCFFCHMEGVVADQEEREPDQEVFLGRLREALAAGFHDVTLTGGEPLLKPDLLREALGNCARHDPVPDLTIVTNGLLFKDEIFAAIAAFRACGKIKVHVSVHSFIPEKYGDITRCADPEGKLTAVKKNIRSLVEAGCHVKLNCVLLRDVNTKGRDLADYLGQAFDLGVGAVKFLELLVVESNKDDYRYSFSAEAAGEMIEQIGGKRKSMHPRGANYHFDQFPALTVEVRRLTCKVGCSKCDALRDRTFDRHGRIHPCFACGSEWIAPCPGQLAQELRAADEFVAQMAIKHGPDNSPVLMKEAAYSRQRLLCFMKSEMDLEEAGRRLRRQGFALREMHSLQADFFHPSNPSEDWIDFRQVVSVDVRPEQSMRARLVLSRQERLPAPNDHLVRQVFTFTPPVSLASRDAAFELLAAMDFFPVAGFEASMQVFAKGALEVSMAEIHGHLMVRLMAPEMAMDTTPTLCALLDAEPLKTPHPVVVAEWERLARPRQKSSPIQPEKRTASATSSNRTPANQERCP